MKKVTNEFHEKFKFFLSAPAFLWQVIFLIIPLFFVFFYAFFEKRTLSFNSKYFLSVIDYAHIKIIFYTLFVAFINTSLCLLIAYPVAYYLAFRAQKLKNFLLTFLMLPLWVNFLVQVYAWFFVLEKNGLVNSMLLNLGLIKEPLHLVNNFFAVILVMVHVYLPFMIMPLYNILEKFDTQLIEASLDLGASKWQTFKKVTFPLSLSGVYLGFFLVFVISYGEVAIPMLLGGNKNFLVGSLISQYFLAAGNTHRGAAFTLISGLVLGVTLLFFSFIFRKKNKEVTL